MGSRRRDSAKELKELEKCGHCTKVVTDRDNGLQCELCEGWFHAACQDVSDEDYKVLSKLEVIVCCVLCACHWSRWSARCNVFCAAYGSMDFSY